MLKTFATITAKGDMIATHKKVAYVLLSCRKKAITKNPYAMPVKITSNNHANLFLAICANIRGIALRPNQVVSLILTLRLFATEKKSLRRQLKLL